MINRNWIHTNCRWKCTVEYLHSLWAGKEFINMTPKEGRFMNVVIYKTVYLLQGGYIYSQISRKMQDIYKNKRLLPWMYKHIL